MSIRAFAAAVIAMAVAAIGGAAAPAHAATPSCGASCINLYNRAIGHSFILNAQGGGMSGSTGQPLILWQRSNSAPAEDFTVADEGTVSDFAAVGLMTPSMNLHFGKDPAFELEYAPYGVDSGLCMGVASAVNGAKVNLQPCGVTAETVWAVDLQVKPIPTNFFVGINGGNTNFSHPLVLTYPDGSFPTDMPRPQLFISNLTGFSSGQVNDSQIWWGKQGVEI